MALFGRSWAKIRATPPPSPPPLQTGSKTSILTSCNRFGPPECSSLRGEANKHYWPQKGAFLAIRARKRPAEQPNRHLPETQRYPELPQDLGNIWFHWIRFVWGQKSALYGRSVEKKNVFWAKNAVFCEESRGIFSTKCANQIHYIVIKQNSQIRQYMVSFWVTTFNTVEDINGYFLHCSRN